MLVPFGIMPRPDRRLCPFWTVCPAGQPVRPVPAEEGWNARLATYEKQNQGEMTPDALRPLAFSTPLMNAVQRDSGRLGQRKLSERSAALHLNATTDVTFSVPPGKAV